MEWVSLITEERRQKVKELTADRNMGVVNRGDKRPFLGERKIEREREYNSIKISLEKTQRKMMMRIASGNRTTSILALLVASYNWHSSHRPPHRREKM